jgi:hypothetical protein
MSEEVWISKVQKRFVGLKCPKCLKQADGATGLSNASGGLETPVPGCLSICLFCGAILQYVEDVTHPHGLGLRLAPADIVVHARRDPVLNKLLEAAELASEAHRRRIQ